MAKVLIFKTDKPHFQADDLLGVFPDDHQFSVDEVANFNIITINGSVADVRARLGQLRPRIEHAHMWESDGEYHWTFPPTENIIQSAEVFQVSNSWYLLVDDFDYYVNLSTLTPQELELLETVDINHPSVDSFINKIKKSLDDQPNNDVEVVELRNTEPIN